MERSEAAQLRPGDPVLYDQNMRNGGFDWRTHEATVRKIGTRRVKISYGDDGKEAWVKPWRIRRPEDME